MAPSAVPEPGETKLPGKSVLNGSSEHGTLATTLPNPSLQVTADHKLKYIEAPVFKPGRGEVLLHVKATGVCGSVTE